MKSRRVVIFGWAESVHVQRWAAGMAERGFEIRVVSLGGEPIPGIDTVILPRRGILSYHLNAQTAATKALEFKPDLIHVHYAGGFGVWGRKCRDLPLLASVWGSDIVDLPRNILQRQIIRRTLRRADHISATSMMLQKTCLHLEPKTREKITVIPFGVRLPDKIEPMPTGSPRACFVKVHRIKYGPYILLKATAEVVKQVPDFHLTMAGEGEITSALKEMVVKLKLERNVDFVGMIDNRKIYSLVAEHDFMVMPSFQESFGVAALEASACGRAVIASEVGGVPEVVRHESTGLLIPPRDVSALADAMLRLARDREECARMGRAGYQFVKENYTWDRSLDMMSALYERLIDASA